MIRSEVQLPNSSLTSTIIVPLVAEYSFIFCSFSHESETKCPFYKSVSQGTEEQEALLLTEKQMVEYHNRLLHREVVPFNVSLPYLASCVSPSHPLHRHREGTQMTSLGLMVLFLFIFHIWGLTDYIFIVTCPFQLIEGFLFPILLHSFFFIFIFFF